MFVKTFIQRLNPNFRRCERFNHISDSAASAGIRELKSQHENMILSDDTNNIIGRSAV